MDFVQENLAMNTFLYLKQTKMKTKKYLQCIMTTYSGQEIKSSLMLKETYLVSRMAQETKSVLVSLERCDVATYNLKFGTNFKEY